MADPKKTTLGWIPTAGTPAHEPAPAAWQGYAHPAHAGQAPAPAHGHVQAHAQPGHGHGYAPQGAHAQAAYAPTAFAQPAYGRQGQAQGQAAYGPPAGPPQPRFAQATPPSPYAQAAAQSGSAQPAARPSPHPQASYAQAAYGQPAAQPQPRYTPPQYRHAPGQGAQQGQGHAQYPASQAQYSQQAYSQQAYSQQAYSQQAYSQQAYSQPAYFQHGAPQQPQPQQPQPSYPQGNPPPYPQQAQPSSPQQPQAQPSPQHDWNQRALAAMHSLRRRRAESGERPIPEANATMDASDRVRFVRLTYLHLLGAILTFSGLLYLLMTNRALYTNVSIPFIKFALGGRWNWGVVLAAFMAVSWVADYWASHARSRGMQYAGLGIYVVAEALTFVPLLAIVAVKTASIIARGGGDPNILRDSALVTLAIFGALTASVFLSKKDFSFLRSALLTASSAALMLIVLSLTFGFNLGLVFSIAMVVLAAGYILYQTSQILAHYHPEQYVAASLALFSSVALMFWYVIRIFLRARN
ncbi:MAG TPA: Bax inhibitor-1 family protein [Kofleriaceae bacterium]|nr:Bax inhibitor-1 family protein [Kofleriaceae bacterium]